MRNKRQVDDSQIQNKTLQNSFLFSTYFTIWQSVIYKCTIMNVCDVVFTLCLCFTAG